MVDPIDGTTNFVHGIPCSVVSIAVAYKAQVVVGVIYEPYRDELFTAVKGEGAFLNDTRIHVSADPAFKNAVFGFGTHYSQHVRAPPTPARTPCRYHDHVHAAFMVTVAGEQAGDSTGHP
ncbi:hypothetical protein EON67_10945, partial [archaeon]